MKYVRTNDGIFEVVKENDGWVDIISNFERKMKCQCCIKKKGIIAQADTIEELCDELVVHNPSNDGEFYPKHFVYKHKWETILQPMSDYYKSKSIEIYGAIWTEKGLIYVAKMNEKGDLELL